MLRRLPVLVVSLMVVLAVSVAFAQPAGPNVKVTATQESQTAGPVLIWGNFNNISNWAGVRLHVSSIDDTEVDTVGQIGTVFVDGVVPGAVDLVESALGLYFDPSWVNSGTRDTVPIGEVTFHVLGTDGASSEFTDIVITGAPILHADFTSAVISGGRSVFIPSSQTINQLQSFAATTNGKPIKTIPAVHPSQGHFSPVGNDRGQFHVAQSSVLYIPNDASTTLLRLGLDHGNGIVPEPVSFGIWAGCGAMFGLVGLILRRRRQRVS